MGLSSLGPAVKPQLQSLRDLLRFRVQRPEQESISFGAGEHVCLHVADARSLELVPSYELPRFGVSPSSPIDEPPHVAEELLALRIETVQRQLGGDEFVNRDHVLEEERLERGDLRPAAEEGRPNVSGYANHPPTRLRVDEDEPRVTPYWLASRRAARSRRRARRASSTTCVFVTGALSLRLRASSTSAFVAERSSSSSRSRVVRTLHRACYASYASVKETILGQQLEGETDTWVRSEI